MGIVKKNGIMIVDFARQRVDAGETAEQAIHDASMDRFRPILMTTLAAVIGAVPIAAGYGADGASRRPLGMVIVGGLVVSQFITLYVTPVIYLYLEAVPGKSAGSHFVLPFGTFADSSVGGDARWSGGLRRGIGSTDFSLWVSFEQAQPCAPQNATTKVCATGGRTLYFARRLRRGPKL